MVLEVSLLIASAGNEMTPITVAVRRSSDYKYLIHSPLRTITHSFPLFALGLPSLALSSPSMENQRGIKHERSPSPEGSPLPNNAKTPPPAPSVSPPPPGSPSEISSRCPCSPVFEHGGSSEKASVIVLSLFSDEENFIANTSRDAEFTKKLFGDLNRDILGPPDDGKVIILDDSNEEKETPDEKTVGTELEATCVAVNPTSTASVVANDAPVGAKDDNSDDQGPNQEASGSNDNGSGDGAP
jgi:hypothetical protein